MKLLATLMLVIFCANQALAQCTVTTASGSHAPQGFCAGDLIFEDNFDNLDLGKWKHEVSMWGGGNNEFQWYVNDRANSFIQNGNLHLRPTYTSDIYGEDFLHSGRIVIPPEECTNSENNGCDRSGGGGCALIPPIRSAKITTWDSFSYKYGTLEIRSKNPAGDWIWPALWLMPRESVYGWWPRSGEIDLMEARGNRDLWSSYPNGGLLGVQQVGAALHFGSDWENNGFTSVAKHINSDIVGFDQNFHLYKMIWTPNDIQFFYDNVHLATFAAGAGFWYQGNFNGENIWAHNPMGPFDQEFFIQLNNAVGGSTYFADSWDNRNGPKPWLNDGQCRERDFWQGRGQWEPTWHMHNDDRDFQIDYVRVWAL